MLCSQYVVTMSTSASHSYRR